VKVVDLSVERGEVQLAACAQEGSLWPVALGELEVVAAVAFAHRFLVGGGR
jgi:hypothetical protein